jgi:hypothetical protein
MSLLATLALDVVLALAGLCSLHIAFAWGELCGVRTGGDKSGLGGFAFVLLFVLLRGVAVALALAVVARAGETWWLLLGHTGLGVLAWRCFEREIRQLQADRWGSVAVACLAGVLVPVPALTLVLVRVNSRWLDQGIETTVAVAVALTLVHGVCLWHRRRGMRCHRRSP